MKTTPSRRNQLFFSNLTINDFLDHANTSTLVAVRLRFFNASSCLGHHATWRVAICYLDAEIRLSPLNIFISGLFGYPISWRFLAIRSKTLPIPLRPIHPLTKTSLRERRTAALKCVSAPLCWNQMSYFGISLSSSLRKISATAGTKSFLRNSKYLFVVRLY